MGFPGAPRSNVVQPPWSGPGGAHGNALSLAFLRRRGAVLGFSLVAIIVIAAADLATGYELALSILYVGSVVAATWAFGLLLALIFIAMVLVYVFPQLVYWLPGQLYGSR